MPQNGGKQCDKKLSRTQKCNDLPPCPLEYNNNQLAGQTLIQNGSNPLKDLIGGQQGGQRNHHGKSFHTTTTTTTASSSMLDDEDDSKFSRLRLSESGILQPASFNANLSMIRDSVGGGGAGLLKPELEVLGSSSFHIRNGHVYLDPIDDYTVTN